MPLNLIRAFSALFFLFFFVSCQRELGELPGSVNPLPELPDTTGQQPVDPPAIPPDNIVFTHVQGEITNDEGDPLTGASVMVGNKTAATDQYGIFRIYNAMVREHHVYVRAEKAGYFSGSRTVITQAGGTVFVKISMMRKIKSGNFAASQGGNINAGGLSIKFPTDGIVDAHGEAFTGNVQVYATPINPEDENFSRLMPGDLRGYNADSQAVALKSFGMLNVLLENESGQPLQLALGKKAAISMKVPASLIATAPGEIPLWHFNESDGMWREEGSATLNNGRYTGEVAHFSTWNYDYPTSFVFVSLNVRILKAGARPYSRVKITDMNTQTYSDLYTDSTGYIRTWVPKNAPLKIDILNDCGEVLASMDSDALSSDKDLGYIYVNTGTLSNSVHGFVKTCNNAPVTVGFANLHLDGLIYTTQIVEGEFYFIVGRCQSVVREADLYITDANNQFTGTMHRITVTNQKVEAGDIDICPREEEYMILRRPGVDSMIYNTEFALKTYEAFNNGDTTTRIYQKQGIYDVGYHEFEIEFYDSTVHTSIVHSPAPLLYYSDWYSPTSPLTVNVHQFGRVGEDIFLTFSGKYRSDITQVEWPFSGELKIRRRK